MAPEEKTSQTEHPQCVSRPRRGGRVRLALLLILVYALSPLGHYGIPKKSSIFDDRISPSGKYRVEFYLPRYCPYAYLVYRHPFFFQSIQYGKETLCLYKQYRHIALLALEYRLAGR